MNALKGYVCVILSGAVLLAAAVFVGLQWGSKSSFSAFGPQMTRPTIWLVLGSGAGGLLVYWMCRLMGRGIGLIRRARRDQAAEAEQKKEA